MRKILCDSCKKEILEEDVRHILFRKENKNTKPMFELCPQCMEDKYNDIKS